MKTYDVPMEIEVKGFVTMKMEAETPAEAFQMASEQVEKEVSDRMERYSIILKRPNHPSYGKDLDRYYRGRCHGCGSNVLISARDMFCSNDSAYPECVGKCPICGSAVDFTEDMCLDDTEGDYL